MVDTMISKISGMSKQDDLAFFQESDQAEEFFKAILSVNES